MENSVVKSNQSIPGKSVI